MLVVRLNPDENIVNEIKEALRNNSGYCPCVTVKRAETKCMCKQFRDQDTEGYCHCGLYYKMRKEK